MTLFVTGVLLLLVKWLIIVLKRCLKKKKTSTGIFQVTASEIHLYFNWILIKIKLLCSKYSNFTHSTRNFKD